jgi:hypothetical protein
MRTVSKRRNGRLASGITEKSGHSFQLNRCSFRMASVSWVAWTVKGLSRIHPTVSTRNGSDAT